VPETVRTHCGSETQIAFWRFRFCPGGSDCSLEAKVEACRLRLQLGVLDCRLEAQIGAWRLRRLSGLCREVENACAGSGRADASDILAP